MNDVIINKLEVERAELSKKISKIRDFLEGKNNKSISNQQHMLLNLQLNAMKSYFDILTFRIIDLRNDNKGVMTMSDLDDEELRATRKRNGVEEEINRQKFFDKLPKEIFDVNSSEDLNFPNKLANFLNEIDLVCQKYDYSISHEDCHGGFIIEKYDERNIKWLCDCFINIED